MITAINKHTGEVVELPADTFQEVVTAWQIAKEYEKVSEALKTQLKKLVPEYIDQTGKSEEHNGYMFRVSNVQRMTYDKAVLRQYLDEDVLDLFLQPKKSAVDNYIKENLEQLGETAGILRKSMVEDGKPYQVIKLEKLERDINA